MRAKIVSTGNYGVRSIKLRAYANIITGREQRTLQPVRIVVQVRPSVGRNVKRNCLKGNKRVENDTFPWTKATSRDDDFDHSRALWENFLFQRSCIIVALDAKLYRS